MSRLSSSAAVGMVMLKLCSISGWSSPMMPNIFPWWLSVAFLPLMNTSDGCCGSS